MREERGGGEGEAITKLDIFHYVYAVLHNPAYRKKYELNLKRDFPRIPLYDDFRQWAAWGQALMELHLNYETAEPYPLERVDLSLDMDGPNHALPLDNPVIQGACHAPLHEPSPTWTKIPKAKLKADREQGRIIIDEQTTLSGIPDIAWEYRLGNRSALE
jgi:predicted helicase